MFDAAGHDRPTSGRLVACFAAALLGTLALALGLAGVARAQSPNPLFKGIKQGSSDPGVSFFAGQFRVTSSRGARVRTSPDLVNWRQDKRLFARRGAPRWAVGRRIGSSKIYFLPAIKRYVLVFDALHRIKGKFCIGRATSKRPYGFRNMGRESARGPLECEGPGLSRSAYSLLDPDLFQDPATGSYYLLYKRQLQSRIDEPPQPSDIVIRPIGPDAKSGLGAPTRLVVAAGKGTKEGVSVEAPTMVARNGRYFLFYSIANFTNDSYAVSVAASRREANTPLGGNFVKFGANPIYSGKPDKDFCGVGHQDVMQTGPDAWVLFAHAYLIERPPAKPGGNARCVSKPVRPGGRTPRRQLVADQLRWDVPSTNPQNTQEGFAWPSVNDGTPSGNGQPRGKLTPASG